MGFQETFNERVMPASNRAFGVPASLRLGIVVIEATVSLGRRDLEVDRRALPLDPTLRLRVQEFVVSSIALVIDDRVTLPKSGDTIDIENVYGEPHTWVAFPLVAGECFKFIDHTETRLTIYGVDSNDLAKIGYTRPGGGQSEVYYGIAGPIRATEEMEPSGNVAGVSALVWLERQTISVIPKGSAREIVDSGKLVVRQIGSTAMEEWTVESVAAATPWLITVELYRRTRKRDAEARARR